jgi:hypothetical protein
MFQVVHDSQEARRFIIHTARGRTSGNIRETARFRRLRLALGVGGRSQGTARDMSSTSGRDDGLQ